jgi:hypothetical protein
MPSYKTVSTNGLIASIRAKKQKLATGATSKPSKLRNQIKRAKKVLRMRASAARKIVNAVKRV